MNAETKRLLHFVIAAVAVSAVSLGWLGAAEPDKTPSVSAYAPAPVLIEQLRLFQEEFEEIVADPEEYDSKATRITRNAHTMAVLALALALHDGQHELKQAAPAILKAAQAAAATQDHEAAKKAVGEIRRAMANSTENGATAPQSWQVVAPMGMLMKQVSFMHTRYNRGARGSRFARRADEYGRYAAVVAVIGQQIMTDTDEVEVKDQADVDRWMQICAEMRDYAGEVSAAYRAKDQEAAQAALKRLEKSCNTCHEVFRVEL